MNTTILIIIAIILGIIIVILVCKYGTATKEYQIEPMLGYVNDNNSYDKPFVWNNFITQEMCKAIIAASSNNLRESEVVGGKNKTIRNSQQHWIPKSNPLVRPLFEKVSERFGIPIENAEDLQVVRYQPGQFYGEHHDACCDANEKCIEFVAKGGQRKLTVLIYLNNEFSEGETHFRNLDLKLKVPPGDAIVFYPLARGTNLCHPKALHAGLPVKSGEKWIANLWFRENKFN